MEQIIGDYKQFVVLERTALDELLKRADDLSEMDDAYSGVRATEIRNVDMGNEINRLHSTNTNATNNKLVCFGTITIISVTPGSIVNTIL
jgi:hypothetical protein